MAYPFRKCCDSPSSTSAPHIKGCKNYIQSRADRYEDLERHNLETIPGYRRKSQ